MDRARPFAKLLGSGAGLVLLAAAAAPTALPREAAWTVPDRRFAVLASEPVECLKLPEDREERLRVLVGGVAFRTPLALGGQAARAGLSCASCHRGGRGNPDFTLPGLSGDAGTADVTSSLMSHARGDGVHNPKPIPDLVLDPPKIARDPASPDLRAFIRGLVVEEFDGAEPPAAVLDGLTAYVRAIRFEACPVVLSAAASPARDLGRVAHAVLAATALLERGDKPGARLMLAGARAELGRIDERFLALPKDRERFARLDAGLRDMQLALDTGRNIDRRLARWRWQFAQAGPAIEARRDQSLYAPALIAKALTEASPTAVATPPAPR